MENFALEMDNRHFFFCYDRKMASYIKDQGIPSITVAMNPGSKKVFTLFFKSRKLNDVIHDYKEKKEYQISTSS